MTDNVEYAMNEALPARLEKLKKALDAGAIDKDTYDAAVAAITAQLSGAGAIAQGTDTVAVGVTGVSVAGDSYGDINTGIIMHLGTRSGASKEDLQHRTAGYGAHEAICSIQDGVQARLTRPTVL